MSAIFAPLDLTYGPQAFYSLNGELGDSSGNENADLTIDGSDCYDTMLGCGIYGKAIGKQTGTQTTLSLSSGDSTFFQWTGPMTIQMIICIHQTPGAGTGTVYFASCGSSTSGASQYNTIFGLGLNNTSYVGRSQLQYFAEELNGTNIGPDTVDAALPFAMPCLIGMQRDVNGNVWLWQNGLKLNDTAIGGDPPDDGASTEFTIGGSSPQVEDWQFSVACYKHCNFQLTDEEMVAEFDRFNVGGYYPRVT